MALASLGYDVSHPTPGLVLDPCSPGRKLTPSPAMETGAWGAEGCLTGASYGLGIFLTQVRLATGR